MEKRFVKYKDVDFILEGIYHKGSPQTHDYPGDNEEFAIHRIYVGEYEVSDMLSEWVVENLEKLALE